MPCYATILILSSNPLNLESILSTERRRKDRVRTIGLFFLFFLCRNLVGKSNTRGPRKRMTTAERRGGLPTVAKISSDE